jgi:hypothetical protein
MNIFNSARKFESAKSASKAEAEEATLSRDAKTARLKTERLAEEKKGQATAGDKIETHGRRQSENAARFVEGRRANAEASKAWKQ